ncbi:hypothetical protein [Escherichia coli]
MATLGRLMSLLSPFDVNALWRRWGVL